MELKGKKLFVLGILLLAMLLLLSSTSIAAKSRTFAYINITNGTYCNYSSENITILENNWIELRNGVNVTIPGLTFVYNGFNETTYSKGNRTVKITVNVDEYTNHQVHYPLRRHQFFYENSTISATLKTNLKGTYCYYIARTYPTQVREIAEMLVNGDTKKFRNLFLNGYNDTINANKTVTIKKLPAGDYLMIVTDNNLKSSHFGIITITGIEVLEYKSKLTAPKLVISGKDLEATMKLIGAPSANYRYGGALIRKEDYVKSHDVKLASKATKVGTNLTFDNVRFIESWRIMGVGLANVNAAIIKDKSLNILSARRYHGALSYTDITTKREKILTFTTDDLPQGKYILSIGTWQAGSNKLVAFGQTEIEVKLPAPPPVAPPGGAGGAVVPPAPPGVTKVSTTLTGEVIASVTPVSADKKATAKIPKGLIAKDAIGNPLTKVKITQPSVLPTTPPSGVDYVGYVYNYGPTGATFSSPIEISIEFDPADFEGKTPVIYTYKAEAGRWERLDTIIVDNKAIAKVIHFSIFVLFAEKVAPTPTPTAIVPPTPPPTPVTPIPTPTPMPPVKPPWRLIIGIIAAIVIAVIVYYFVKKRG